MRAEFGRAGLTLIEIIVTITILAITLAFGALSLNSSVSGESITGVAKTIERAIALARYEAIRSNSTVTLIFDVKAKTIRLLGRAGEELYSSRIDAKSTEIENTRDCRNDDIGSIRFDASGAVVEIRNSAAAPLGSGSPPIVFTLKNPAVDDSKNIVVALHRSGISKTYPLARFTHRGAGSACQ